MNSYYLRGNNSGRYFVLGSGFTATTKATASRLNDAQVAAARGLGFEPSTTEAATVSFATNYVRPQNRSTRFANGRIRNVVDVDNNNPSAKRFATLGEALNHGARKVLEMGHVGFWVTETNDAVTHYVSVKDDPKGLTCPIENA